MPDNTELDDFLKPEEPLPSPEPQAEAPAEAQPAETPATEPDDEEIPDEPGHTVPVQALISERAKRKDWKEQKLRLEGEFGAYKAATEAELKSLKEKVETAAKAPPSAPPVPQQPGQFPPPPNPAEDPVAYANWQRENDFNFRVNVGEKAMRADPKYADLDAKVAIFLEAANLDPHLQAMARIQPDPMRWAYEQASRIQDERTEAEKRAAMLAEIGTDPAAYREKLRQEWEAERAKQPPPAPAARPAPPPPPFQSLASARSVQGRGEVVQPEPSLDELFPN